MNPRRASLEDREPAAPTADTRSGGIGDITQQIANLQTETSTKENINFFIHYIKRVGEGLETLPKH